MIAQLVPITVPSLLIFLSLSLSFPLTVAELAYQLQPLHIFNKRQAEHEHSSFRLKRIIHQLSRSHEDITERTLGNLGSAELGQLLTWSRAHTTIRTASSPFEELQRSTHLIELNSNSFCFCFFPPSNELMSLTSSSSRCCSVVLPIALISQSNYLQNFVT